jgi:hypothetical protein
MKHLLASAILILLSACGDQSPEITAEASAGATLPPVAPAIVPPQEVADPTEPPSYEVAIASAAAEHNTAKERCSKQPETVRARCEQEANAAFTETQGDLDDLRGNQP